jgi:hypothetical protein
MAKYYDILWIDGLPKVQYVESIGEDVFDIALNSPPMKTVSPHASARWYTASETIEIHRIRIPGMVYFGASLPTVKGFGSEPALINPVLRVGSPSEGYQDRDLTLQPSYDQLSPRSRRIYLQWLAEGRKDPEIPMEFVMLFFYGLERRLLADKCSREEQTELVTEIERLRIVYGKNPAFRDYSYRLIDFLKAIELDGYVGYVKKCPAPLVQQSADGAYGSALRVGLGLHAASGTEIPPSWALSWGKSHPAYRRRTAADRCAQELEDLFRHKYAQAFPYGLYLPLRTRKVDFHYEPVSPSFGRCLERQSHYADVTLYDEPGMSLKDLVMSSLEELDAYSRHLGRHPEATGTLLAAPFLPEALVQPYLDRVAPELRSWLDSMLQDGIAVVTASDLLDRAEIRRGTLPQKDFVLFVQLLTLLKVGVEPDPRLEKAMLNGDTPLVLFQLNAEPPTSTSAEYTTATAALNLAVAVDLGGEADRIKQLNLFETRIAQRFELSQKEKLRLRARALLLSRIGVDPKSLRKSIGLLGQGQRDTIGQVLLDFAHAVDHNSPSAIDKLLQAFSLLRLSPERVFSAIHSRGSDLTAPRCGMACSAKAGKAYGPAIDMDRVRALSSESDHVSTLLEQVFVTEEQPEASAPAINEGALSLDELHLRFLGRVLDREKWTRIDLQSAANECGVLLEAAIDKLNELALDRYEDLLLEENEPMYVNLRVAQELINEFD